jgi:hypothetical protein
MYRKMSQCPICYGLMNERHTAERIFADAKAYLVAPANLSSSEREKWRGITLEAGIRAQIARRELENHQGSIIHAHPSVKLGLVFGRSVIE